MNSLFLLAAGLVLLTLGGDLLVRGSVSLAERAGLSPLLIGLVLVGFGTSTPELVTSVNAAIAGSPGIAIGNIVGSNIANILLILGFVALLSPIVVSSSALKRDGVIVVSTALLFAGVSALFPLGHAIGGAFVALLVAYLFYAWFQERGSANGHTAAFEKGEAFSVTHLKLQKAGPHWVKPLGLALAGLALLVFGGSMLVQGAVSLARGLGVSETVIGLTIVAIGTSLPEFITSIVAAARRQTDIALGNILGSNIYNILGIGGLTALIAPSAVPVEIVRFDNLVMVATSVLLLVVAYTGFRIGRREGGLLLAGYGLYVWSIWPA